MKKDIAIIITSHNDLSRECLESIQAVRARTQHTVGVVIADNASKTYAANEVVAPIIPDAIVLLRNGDFGYGRSMNRGAQEIEAKYYFILNPDTVLSDENILNVFWDYMEVNQNVGLVGPRLLSFTGQLQETCREFPSWIVPFIQRTGLKNKPFGQKYLERFLMRSFDHASIKDVDWVQGSAMFVRGDVWRAIGGFDHRYWLYYEDVDLCRTIWEKGFRVVYNPETHLQHAHNRQSAQVKNILINLLTVKETRGHIVSWLKYTFKWFGTKLPEKILPGATKLATLKELPKVGLVYLTYNGKDSYRDITRCFNTLAAINYPLEKLTVFCVENPSIHGNSWSFIEKEWLPRAGKDFPKLVIHKNEKDLGYSGACNVGLKMSAEAGCEYTYLLNQDTDVDPDFLINAVTRAANDEKIMFVQSLLLLGQEKEKVNSLGNRLHFLGYGYSGGYGVSKQQALEQLQVERGTNPDLAVPYFSGAAVLIRNAAAQEIGLYDAPYYMYHEDVDASLNAQLHGYKVVIEPTSIVYHYYEFGRSVGKIFWMEKNRLITHASVLKIPTLILLAPWFVCVEAASLLFAIKGGWWQQKLRAWMEFIKPATWAWISARRKRLQKERKISDRSLMRAWTGKILFQNADDPTGAGGSVMRYVANPILSVAWKITYFLVRW